MHWCPDETAAVMTFLGSLGVALTWVKTRGKAAWGRIKTLFVR